VAISPPSPNLARQTRTHFPDDYFPKSRRLQGLDNESPASFCAHPPGLRPLRRQGESHRGPRVPGDSPLPEKSLAFRTQRNLLLTAAGERLVQVTLW